MAAPTASAGWISIKNESKIAVVLQELLDHTTPKRGKIVRLLPGETYREYHPNPGEKRFHLFDLHGTNRPLFLGVVKWPRGDVDLRVRSVRGAVTIVPVARPGNAEPAVVTASIDGPKP